MKLRAKVEELVGRSANFVGTIVDDCPTPVAKLPDPEWLEISEEDGSHFLYYLD